ncbi:hypothetical protein N7490_011277 [Penicillium lividum]|nr:hypothetical protein N7490_011277 [Penicillium lividum]
MPPTNSLRLHVYLAWVSAWLSTSSDVSCEAGMPIMSVEEMANLFQEQNLNRLLDSGKLAQVVTSFRHMVNAQKILLGGTRRGMLFH